MKQLDDTEPERWVELEASDSVFALVLMAQNALQRLFEIAPAWGLVALGLGAGSGWGEGDSILNGSYIPLGD